MSSLNELTADFIGLVDMADDPDIDEQAFRDTLEGILGALEDKADDYVKAIRIINAEAKACKEESDRLAKRAATKEANVERMKKALKWAMEVTEMPKIKTAYNTIWIQKNQASVVVDEAYIENIPERFLKRKDPEVNKSEIKKALAAGDEEAMAIAHLEQTESVRIK